MSTTDERIAALVQAMNELLDIVLAVPLRDEDLVKLRAWSEKHPAVPKV